MVSTIADVAFASASALKLKLNVKNGLEDVEVNLAKNPFVLSAPSPAAPSLSSDSILVSNDWTLLKLMQHV